MFGAPFEKYISNKDQIFETTSVFAKPTGYICKV
jgi:hypothetical protein